MICNSPSKYLFVYGTLRLAAQSEAATLLHESADFVVSARARGHLYLISDYPGFVPSSAASDWVHGDVFSLRSPESTYAQLDKYEGCRPADPPPHEYRRSILPILLDNGAWIEASIYIYMRDASGKPRIHSGDWIFRSRPLHPN